MNKELKGFIVGVAITSIITFTLSGIAEGVLKNIDVAVNSINLKVNGKLITTDNFVYNGSTYVGLRAVGEMLGKNIVWDDATKTAEVNDKDYVEPKVDVNKKENSSYPFSLSDNDIKEAIEKGKGDFSSLVDTLDSEYNLKPNNSDYNIFSGVTLLTPYHQIIRTSALKNCKFEDYSFDNAKETASLLSNFNSLNFEVHLYSNDIDCQKLTQFVLVQGNSIIKPTSVEGLNDLGDITSSFPKFPSYKKIVNLNFELDYSKIDVNKPVQYKVIYAPGQESVYELNLKDYK